MADRLDPATRARVSAAGGAATAAALTAEQRSAGAATAARGLHTPQALARRLDRAWRGLDAAGRAAVLAELGTLLEDCGVERLDLADAVVDGAVEAEQVDQVARQAGRTGRQRVRKAPSA